MKKKTKQSILKRLSKKSYLLVIAVGIFFYMQDYLDKNASSTTTQNGIVFSACVDGDTAKLMIDGEEQTVRFLAVNTPETKHPTKGKEFYGEEASEYTCSMLNNATKIELEYEESNKTDKYGRTLAWIWIDGNLLQRSLVSEGYATVDYIYGDYRYTDELYSLQDYAEENKLGMWK